MGLGFIVLLVTRVFLRLYGQTISLPLMAVDTIINKYLGKKNADAVELI